MRKARHSSVPEKERRQALGRFVNEIHTTGPAAVWKQENEHDQHEHHAQRGTVTATARRLIRVGQQEPQTKLHRIDVPGAERRDKTWS